MTELIASDHLARFGALVTVAFARSNSIQYPMAVHLARQAASYSRLDDEKDSKKEIHLAIFAKTKEQAAHAAALIRVVATWKTMQIHTSSKIDANPMQVSHVLECYFQSLALQDHRAHCYWFDRDSVHEEDLGQLIPCAQLRGYIETGLRARTEDRALKIPTSERVHAIAIQRNCDWCPHFSIRDC